MSGTIPELLVQIKAGTRGCKRRRTRFHFGFMLAFRRVRSVFRSCPLANAQYNLAEHVPLGKPLVRLRRLLERIGCDDGCP